MAVVVVSIIVFYYENPSLNPADLYNIYCFKIG